MSDNTENKPEDKDLYDDGLRYNPDPLAGLSPEARKRQEDFAREIRESTQDKS